MKNVNEIRVFLRKAINDGKSLAEDGIKDIGAVLSKVIGLIGPGQDAAEDYRQYGPEIGASTNDQMDESDAQLSGLFSNFSKEDQRDYDAMEKGIVAITRKVARAKQEGAVEERAKIKAELQAAGVDFAQVRSLT